MKVFLYVALSASIFCVFGGLYNIYDCRITHKACRSIMKNVRPSSESYDVCCKVLNGNRKELKKQILLVLLSVLTGAFWLYRLRSM